MERGDRTATFEFQLAAHFGHVLLDDVPGLGEVRRKALLRRFGSLRKLRAATVEEIAEVPGIGPQTAQRIADALGQQGAPSPGVNTATGEIEEGD